MAAIPLLAAIVALDIAWAAVHGSTGSLAYGIADEPAHLATCAIVLLAVAACRRAPLPMPLVVAALLASVAIDVDHIPGYLGWDWLTESSPRPYSHGAATAAVLAGLGLAAKGQRARLVAAGLALGVAAHLLRDLGTGPGVPLLWPLTGASFSLPYAVYAGILAGLCLTALRGTLPAWRRRQAIAVSTAAAAGVLVALGAALPGPAGAHVVASGAYIPGSDRNPGLIDDYAAAAGRPPVIVSFYRSWNFPPFEPKVLGPVAERNAVPMITWEPWNGEDSPVSLASIAAGAEDDYLVESARSAAAWGGPIFVRFAHEMNGRWYPWGREGPAAFIAAWRRVVWIFRDHGAHNVKWVWCPYVSQGKHRRFGRFYPGDGTVDWACLDGFNWGSYRTWQSFGRIFGKPYQELIRLTSRPVMIGETGVSQSGGDKSSWVSMTFRHKLRRYTHVRALVMYSAADHRADFRIDSSPEALAAMRGALETNLFASSQQLLLSTPPELPAIHRHRRLRR